MADAIAAAADAKLEDQKGRGGRRRLRLILILGIPLLLGAGAATVAVLKPSLIPGLDGLLPHSAAPASEAARPVFVEIPEMTVTLPNAGRPRQLRIRITLELAKDDPDQKPADLLGPRVYDALVTYLRTLRDSELDGAVAIDRLRGDLYRRLDLLLGRGVLRDVLITSLVVG